MAKAQDPEYHVSADVIGHMQIMEDLPPVGQACRAMWSGIDVTGEVFAHVPHPHQEGWGFALIKFR